jgi:hypothetical protein
MGRRSSRVTRWARWLATFVGFPIAGVVARACVGGIDDVAAAVVGGLVAGAVLGAVQAFVGGIGANLRLRWVVATAGGLSVGLAVGSRIVDYRTDTASLVVMGAICGAVVGAGQALSVPMSVRDRLIWAIATPALWAAGWWITSQVIVDADRHHAIFGSSGAIVVSAIAGLLVAARGANAPQTREPVPASSVASAS